MKKSLFILTILVFINVVLLAQNPASWTNWEELYSDNQIKVEIKYKIIENGCSNGGQNSKYKYKISGSAHYSDKFVYWKMKYKDCNNVIQEKQNKVAIGGSNVTIGELKSMDYMFVAKKMIKKQYDIGTSMNNNQNNNQNNYQNNNSNNIVNEENSNYHTNTHKVKNKNNYSKSTANRSKYRSDKRTKRKTIPFKYCFMLGGGVYTDMGQTKNIDFTKIGQQIYNPFITAGLYRKIWIKKEKFTRNKQRDISRSTFVGVFSDFGLVDFISSDSSNIDNSYKKGFLKLEAGFNFFEIVRLSAGILDYNLTDGFKDFKYSATLGLTLKIRKTHLYINYIQLANQELNSYDTYLQGGISFYLNFYRSVPRVEKRSLKNKYGL